MSWEIAFGKNARAKGAALAALTALALALSIAACALAPAFALADDDGDDANLVNPQQRPDSSFIYDSSIADLASADSYYDKQTVQVTGEAVGEAIDAGSGMVWVALADESNANATVSVLMTRESASHIDEFGRYGVTGTTLQVRGQFNLACSEHEGLSDLHAQSVAVMKKGVQHPDALRPESFIPGVALVVVGLALMLLFRHLREKLR